MPGSASERRDSARTAVVWAALGSILDKQSLDQPGLDVLDIGGGTGGFAVRVAGLGHRVTVVDPSPDALAALARRAREDGVEVAGQQGDLGSLLELVDPAGDVVLTTVCSGGRRPRRRTGHDPRVLRPAAGSASGRPAARRGHRPCHGRPRRPGAGTAR
jgi:SAM-dependent methyltransferase